MQCTPEVYTLERNTCFPIGMGRAKPSSGTERPPKYYLTNFDRSIRFPSDDPSLRALPVSGGDHDRPPEIVDVNAECDSFPIDVFYMGHIMKH